MAFQAVFKRYELKYMITLSQKESLLREMAPYMELDQYGRTTIRNIYYDTDTYLLIRRSIDKPVYKEKLRLRSYGDGDGPAFAELKKKYADVVYKRRLALPEGEAKSWIAGKTDFRNPTQIAKEVDYFIRSYEKLRPTVFLSYEREAYYARDGSDFRVTFDDSIVCRQEELSLKSPIYGASSLPEGYVLMEIKCSGGIPLWMTEILSRERIYKTSFSKYGTAYKTVIFPRLRGETTEVETNA